MISVVKKYKIEISIGLAFWFVTGFLIGAMNSAVAREAGSYLKDKDGNPSFVSANHTGCIYKSLASVLNPGYIVGCELFRKRFAHEGIEKIFSGERK